MVFGASDELLREFEADRRRWLEAREGRRPYWTPGARLEPREGDALRVALLLKRVDRGSAPGSGRSRVSRRLDGPERSESVGGAT